MDPAHYVARGQASFFWLGGASICSIRFCPFLFSCPDKYPLGFTRRPTVCITLRNHTPMKNYVFS